MEAELPADREERIKALTKRVEVEEGVEKLKEAVDTHMSPEEIRARLAAAVKERDALTSKIEAIENPEFAELKAGLNDTVDHLRQINAKKAVALTEKFKLDTRYGDQIRKLEEQLKALKEKRAMEVRHFERDLSDAKKEEAEVTKEMRDSAADLIVYCREKGFDPYPHLDGVRSLEVPTLKSKRLTTKPVEAPVTYPKSWFILDRAMAWREWKPWLKERGVTVVADRSKIDPYKRVTGPEVEAALAKCDVRINRSMLT